MTPQQRRRQHGGPSVTTEPHPTTISNGRVVNVQSTPQWRDHDIFCGDCGNRLVFGRDGIYRHRQQSR